MVSIRGAITINSNTREDIINKTKELLINITDKNNLKNQQIISIIFSATKDITAAYPAIAAREIGLVDTSLLCVQEMFVEGSLEMCIRVLIHAQLECTQKEINHVYMDGAEVLRPDLNAIDN